MSYAHTTEVLSDGFATDSNPLHNLETWNNHTNGAYIKSSGGKALNCATGASDCQIHVLNAWEAHDDVSVEALCTVSSSHSGVLARFNASTVNGYMARIDGSYFRLYSVVDNVWTMLGSVSGATGNTVRLECSGTAIKAYKDGAEVISVTNSDHSSGRCGIRMYLAPSTPEGRSTVDNFKILVSAKNKASALCPLAGRLIGFSAAT